MSSCFSSSSVGYPNWVRGGLVAKLGTRREDTNTSFRVLRRREEGIGRPRVVQRGEGDRWMRERERGEIWKRRESARWIERIAFSLGLEWEDAWETAPDRGERSEGAALGFIIQGYWFPSTSYHQPTQHHHQRARAKERGGKNEGDGTRKRLTAALSLSFFHPSFPFHPIPYPPICLFCFSLSFILLRYSIPTASTYILTDMHLNQLLRWYNE